MNSAVISGAPSRWRLKPREEKTALSFHDEKRIRGELAAAEWNRDVLYLGLYVSGFVTIVATATIVANLTMRVVGWEPFLPPEEQTIFVMLCPLFGLIVTCWKFTDRYVTALKVIHQLHTTADSDRETSHV